MEQMYVCVHSIVYSFGMKWNCLPMCVHVLLLCMYYLDLVSSLQSRNQWFMN